MGQGRVPPPQTGLFSGRPTPSAWNTPAPCTMSTVGGKAGRHGPHGGFRERPQSRLQLRDLLRARRGPHAAAGPGPGVAWEPSRWNWCAEMRVAFFSPLPPARSGIADYSEALIESLAAARRRWRCSPAPDQPIRPRALRHRPLPGRQQRVPRLRLRDGPAAPGRGGDARIEPAPPDRRPHDPARRLGRLRQRVRVQRRRRGPRVRRASAAARSRARITKACR